MPNIKYLNKMKCWYLKVYNKFIIDFKFYSIFKIFIPSRIIKNSKFYIIALEVINMDIIMNYLLNNNYITKIIRILLSMG